MSELITIMSMLRSLSSRRAWIEIANGPPATRHTGRSLSSRRAWIEIPWPTPTAPKPSSRSPHGERGLKFFNPCNPRGLRGSLSSRRAWIEIVICVPASRHGESLSSRRAWIEITTPWKSLRHSCGRSPHGERGLKCSVHCVFLPFYLCRSPHGERGLKYHVLVLPHVVDGRSPHGERGLKFPPPARCTIPSLVALLTESVD